MEVARGKTARFLFLLEDGKGGLIVLPCGMGSLPLGFIRAGAAQPHLHGPWTAPGGHR